METVENGREMAEEHAGVDEQRQNTNPIPKFALEKPPSEWTNSEKAEVTKWHEAMKKQNEARKEVYKKFGVDLNGLNVENPVTMFAMYKNNDLEGFEDYIIYSLAMLYRLTGECPPKDSDMAAKLSFEGQFLPNLSFIAARNRQIVFYYFSFFLSSCSNPKILFQ